MDIADTTQNQIYIKYATTFKFYYVWGINHTTLVCFHKYIIVLFVGNDASTNSKSLPKICINTT